MFWKRHKKNTDSPIIHIVSVETPDMEAPEQIRRIIYGKLYDTSKSEKICQLQLSTEEIPDRKIGGAFYGKVTLYQTKNTQEFFICVDGQYLQLVDDDWVEDVLARKNVDKYIEIFGEVEEA